MNPAAAPAGHQVSILGDGGWRIVRYSPSKAAFGFASILDPDSPITGAVLGEAGRDEIEQFVEELVNAYRLWYLMDVPPDAPTKRILEQLEAVDSGGRLRVPVISQDDLQQMRSIALWFGEALWPHLVDMLPQIGAVAEELGYGAPEMLGEVTLAAWEMASDRAVRLLVDRGVILPPVSSRGQALLIGSRR
jgi:hypothetical protein